MAIFTKEDLVNTYNWPANGASNPKLKGRPDSSLFNRQDGFEVLYMIQQCMEDWDMHAVSSGKLIEKLINKAPTNIKSQAHVKNWIDENWKGF